MTFRDPSQSLKTQNSIPYHLMGCAGDLAAEDVLEAELAAEKESEKAQQRTKPLGRGEVVDK